MGMCGNEIRRLRIMIEGKIILTGLRINRGSPTSPTIYDVLQRICVYACELTLACGCLRQQQRKSRLGVFLGSSH
jgi:hypothetical protein